MIAARVVRPSFLALVFLLVLAFSGCGQSSNLSAITPKITPQINRGHSESSASKPTRAASAQATIGSDEVVPVRLVIPVIGINAAIERVAIATNGDLATPTSHPWDDAGWYELGTHPGERGSTVIDGHLDRPGGFPAVFWNLRKLHSGEQVMVTDTQGKTLYYRVLQVAFYLPQAAPLQAIFGNNGGSYLNLITCAGDWIPSQHQTTLRLVVYTELVS